MKADKGGRVASPGARGLAMTEIKLGRTPHSLPRRSNSPRRNAVKTGAKTGALSIPHLNGSFPEFILRWMIGGSARASRAVSSTLAGNIGEGVRRGRRTRQPARLCSPFQNCAAGAKVIVTRDEDLLALGKPFGIQINTLRELLVHLAKSI